MGDQELSLDTIITAIGELKELVHRSFGPHSQAVLMQQPAGQVVITSTGLDIFKAIAATSPIMKLVIQNVESMNNVVGDGSKTYIILLQELLYLVQKKYTNNTWGQSEAQWRCGITRELMKFETILLPSLLPRVLRYCDSVQLTDQQRCIGSEKCKVLIQTFFKGRFSSVVSKKLGQLLWSYIDQCCINMDNFSDFIQEMIKDFPLKCIEVFNQPLSDSLIVRGFIISRDMALNAGILEKCRQVEQACTKSPFDCSEKHEVKFVLWKLQQEDTSGNNPMFHVATGQELGSVLLSENKKYEYIFDHYKAMGVSLIISTRHFDNCMLYLCRERAISVIHSVMLEEAEGLEKITNTEPVIQAEERIDESNVGIVANIQPVILGTNKYINIRFHEESKHVNQIVISGPTQGLCKQYSRACLNCLKVMRSWMSYGFYNMQNSQEVLGHVDHNRFSDKSRHENGRAHLGVSDQMKKGDSDASRWESECGSAVTLGNCGVALPCHGFFEYLIHYFISEILKSNSVQSCTEATNPESKCSRFIEPIVLQIIGDALLAVPRTLFANCFRDGKREFLLERERALSEIESGSWREGITNPGLEPLYMKVFILQHVINTVCMILRIEKMCSCGKRIKDVLVQSDEEDSSS